MYFSQFLEAVAAKTGQQPKKSGKGYIALCPGHDDRNPSLSIQEDKDQKILIHCHAGCDPQTICAGLGISLSDLFKEKSKSRSKQVKTEYVFVDEGGKPVYKKTRLEPGKDGKKKDFFISSLSSKGVWKNEISKTSKRFLYRLDEVKAGIEKGEKIFLVEGEKDAERLRQGNLNATTTLEGAGAEIRPEYVEQLKGGEIVLLFDEDAAGHVRRDRLCLALFENVKSLKVISLPGLDYREDHGLDVSDWLSRGHTIQELAQLVEATAPINKTEIEKIRLKQESNLFSMEEIVVITLDDFLKRNIPPREMILSPILPSQGLVMIYAKTGVGKTFVALMIAYAVALGDKVFSWQAPKPRKVLYIDGEMPAATMQDRLRLIAKGMGRNLEDPSNFRIITQDLQPNGIPDLATKEGQEIIESVLGDAELLILDNLSCLVRRVQENESDSWLPIQEWLLKLRRKGISVLFIHHAGKSGIQRGTSRREDVLDAIIALRHPPSYKHEEGAKFIVKNEKPRGIVGKDVEPFIAQLHVSAESGLRWEIIENKEVDADEHYEKVVELSIEGKSIRNIAKILEISRSKVHALIIKARETGDLSEEDE